VPFSFRKHSAVAALVAVSAAALSAVTSRTARADEPSRAVAEPVATRRSSFTMGFVVGPMLGQVAGFPNDAKKIGRASYYTETGLGLGGAGTAWVGVALADWLTFGLGASGDIFRASGLTARTLAFTVHIETFPIFTLGGPYRDLGIMLDAGTGVTTVKAASGPTLIDSGGASRVGLGFFYEGLRLGKFAMGPYVAADYVWSDASRRMGTMLGWRTAFYAKP
jgi:hypothetical protein